MKLLILALCVAFVAADYHWVQLTVTEAEFVHISWDAVKNHETEILYAIFEAYPTIQAKFPKFSGHSLDDLKGTADFAVHATRIVSFMSTVFSLLGHEDAVPAYKTLMNDMGHNHKNRKVSKDEFNEFRHAFFDYMSKHYSSWNDTYKDAWNKAFDQMYFVIFENLDGKTVN